MAGRAVKNWYLVHRWTSVICMVFLLMLCITGLPLIFYTEIEQLLGEAPVTRILPVGRSYVPLDEVVAAAQAQHPGDAVQYVTYDEVNPDIVYITLGRTPASDDTHFVTLDVRTAEILNVPQFENTALYVFFELHVDMFAGLPGELFLGLMGLLFVASIVSGIVVYGPFMRRLNFGTVRRTRARRLLWLDLHNLLGIAITMWMLVVGFTGVLNTLATPILQMWQVDQLADLVAPYKGRPAPAALSSVGDAVATARAAAPNLEPSFIAYPGTLFSSKHHYAVF